MTGDRGADRRRALYDELMAERGAPGGRTGPTAADFRRRRLAALVVALAVAATGAGIALLLTRDSDDDGAGSRLVTEGVPLPIGFRWPPMVQASADPLTGAPLRFPSERAARTEVTTAALCAWWAEYAAAAAERNDSRARSALAGHAEALALVPRLEDGGDAGADPSVLAAEERLRDEAAAGRTAAITANLSTNCAGPLVPVRAPG